VGGGGYLLVSPEKRALELYVKGGPSSGLDHLSIGFFRRAGLVVWFHLTLGIFCSRQIAHPFRALGGRGGRWVVALEGCGRRVRHFYSERQASWRTRTHSKDYLKRVGKRIVRSGAPEEEEPPKMRVLDWSGPPSHQRGGRRLMPWGGVGGGMHSLWFSTGVGGGIFFNLRKGVLQIPGDDKLCVEERIFH